MKLLTKENLRKLPPLKTHESTPLTNVPVVVKFFNPCGAGTWYASEYDPEDRLFYGAADLGMGAEVGHFSLKELESIKAPPFGLSIERDRYFDGGTLGEVMDGRKP